MSSRTRLRGSPLLAATIAVLTAVTLPAIPAAAAPQGERPVPPAAGPCGPMDVALVLDQTSSMSTALANLKTGMPGITSAIAGASGGDYRIGLISFDDDIRVWSPLVAGNAAAINTQVNSVPVTGGGMVPEASDEAAHTAVRTLAGGGSRPDQTGNFTVPWRSNATKLVVLVTDALPGGFDDAFATADQTNATAAAAAAFTDGIKINAVAVGTGGPAPFAAIMTNYATQTAGAYFPTTAPSGVATTIARSMTDCPKTDVYTRDYVGDAGAQPSLGVSQSPDISLCPTATTYCAPGSFVPPPGITAYFHVRLNNAGPYGAGTGRGTLKLYRTSFGAAALWQSHWTQIGTSVRTVPAGVTTAVIPWFVTAGTWCFLTRWVSATDPMGSPETTATVTNAKNNNNIAWRNIHIEGITGGIKHPVKFQLGNDAVGRAETNLVIAPIGKPFIGQGKITVDLGPELAARWRENGARGVGVKLVGESEVEIYDAREARIEGLVLEDGERVETVFTFTGSEPSDEPYVIHAYQTDKDNEYSGGGEFHLTVTK